MAWPSRALWARASHDIVAPMSLRAPALLALAVLAVGCSEESAQTGDEQEVVVRTDTPEAWAQYLADVGFAKSYVAACAPTDSGRPRVLVTGFGRFMSNATNASGQVVSTLVPGLEYPMTEPPAAGQVDDPAPQTRVTQSTITLDRVGEVDVCGMVLPVAWDLSAILVLREIEAFQPDMVLMNGIAGSTQPIWIELGSVNRAMAAPDGSGTLEVATEGAPLVKSAPASEQQKGLYLSWKAVRSAAEEAIAAHAADLDEELPFQETLSGAVFAGFPRHSNTYLCNNTTYVVNYLMDHPGTGVKLLTPSHKQAGSPTGVVARVTSDLREVPRVFVHWPSALRGDHLGSAAAVMASILDGQVDASRSGDLPSEGDNALADIPADG